jgi:hypothetical protein
MNKYTGFKRATNEFYHILAGDDMGWQEADTIFIGIDGKNHTGATPSEEDVALFKEWYSTNPHTARRYTISHVDTCCSDYFGGHHLPNFSIMVTGESTYAYLKEVMLDWQTTDHLDHELFRDSEDYNNFRDAIEELFQDSEDMGTMQDTFDPRIDTPQTEEEWEYWDVNAFFVVEMEEDESVVSDTTGEDHAI